MYNMWSSIGDCIGLPFTSVKRYPVIPTFGLEELTGSVTWPCTAEGCPIDPYVQHPIGKQFVDGKKTVAVPRSMLKFQQWRDAPPNMNNEAMVFSPSRSPDTAMEYNIILSGVQILVRLELCVHVDYRNNQTELNFLYCMSIASQCKASYLLARFVSKINNHT